MMDNQRNKELAKIRAIAKNDEVKQQLAQAALDPPKTSKAGEDSQQSLKPR